MSRTTPGPVAACGALLGYSVVIIALTMLKAFFVIGYLWVPERQRVRELHLIPFEKFFTSSTIFGPVFDVVGNIAFFVPFGVLAFIWLEATYRSLSQAALLRRTVLMACVVSLCIEILQYSCALGRTDVDDLIFNTLGGLIGASVAAFVGRRLYWVWLIGAYILVVIFGVLVVLGQRLGDPNAVVG